MSNYLKPHELVERWNRVVTIGTLANWRSKKVGPAFVKLRGRILYPTPQVEAWEKQNLRGANDNAAAVEGVA